MNMTFDECYDLAVYANEAWKGGYSPRTIAINAFDYYTDIKLSIEENKLTWTVSNLIEKLIDDNSVEANYFMDKILLDCGVPARTVVAIRNLMQAMSDLTGSFNMFIETCEYYESTGRDLNDLNGFVTLYPFSESLYDVNIDAWNDTCMAALRKQLTT